LKLIIVIKIVFDQFFQFINRFLSFFKTDTVLRFKKPVLVLIF
jgi:hypothetical protein